MTPKRAWRRLSLRARLMLVGVAGLVGGLLVGGFLLVAVLGSTLHGGAEDDARDTASALAALIAEDSLPDPIPVSGDDMRAQVLDGQGRIVAASREADRLVPFLYTDERPAAGAAEPVSVYIPGPRIGVKGPVQVVALPAGTADAPRTVLVAKQLDDVVRAVELLKDSLLIAYPLLVLLLAAIAWRVVGATLRPVEALRAGAEAITDGRRAERLPVPESRDEIHRLAVTLNGMLARLESSRARQRAFVADAAHELRSPLANMRTQLEVAQRIGQLKAARETGQLKAARETDQPKAARETGQLEAARETGQLEAARETGQLEAARETGDQADLAALTEDLLADVQRLSRLVDDLLLLAHADDVAGRDGVDLPCGPVDVGGLLSTVAARYPGRVTLDPPATPLWTIGDEAALDRVVANLLDNAVRHARTTVVLSGAAEPGWVVVTVTDDGPGIPEVDRDRVFDRFTRLDDARARDAGGAGLGLSIVRELVSRHGGTVTLGDAGPGLRAEVRLPVAEPETDPEDAEPEDAEPENAEPEDAGPGQPRLVQTGRALPTTSEE